MAIGKFSSSRKSLAAASLTALVLLAMAVPAARHAWRGQTGDFTHFWQAAQAMLHGDDIYASGRGYYIYPPLLAFILQPFALFSEKSAAIIWLVSNLLLTSAALLIASKETAARWWFPGKDFDPSTPWLIAAITTVLIADKIRSIFSLGQIDCLMLLGFALVLRWMDRAPVWAGCAAGAVANFKYLTLIFVPYFLLKRNYRAALASLLSFGFFLMLPAVEVGLHRGVGYAGTALSGLGNLFGVRFGSALPKMPEITWDRSVSLTSAVFRLIRAGGLSDSVATIVVLLLFVAVMTVIIVICRQHGVGIFRPITEPAGPLREATASLEWAILVFVAIAFSPHTTARQLVLVSLIFVAAIALILTPAAKETRALLIVATAVAVAGLIFPPFGFGINRAYWIWREIGGASWCALVLILAVVWAGSRAISQRPNSPTSHSPLATHH